MSAASHGRGRWSRQEQPGGDGGLLVQVIFLVGQRRQPVVLLLVSAVSEGFKRVPPETSNYVELLSSLILVVFQDRKSLEDNPLFIYLF